MAGSKRSNLGRDLVHDEDVYFDEAPSRSRSRTFEDRFQDRAAPWFAYLFVGIGGWFALIILGMIVFQIIQQLMQLGNSAYNVYRSFGVPYIGNGIISRLMYFGFNWFTVIPAFGLAWIPAWYIHTRKRRQRLANTGDELLDFAGDSKLATLDELVAKYPVVPNKGAHFDGVDATAIVSHMVFDNHGIEEQLLPVLAPGDHKGLDEIGSAALPVYETNKRTGEKRIKRKMQPLMDPEEGIRMLKTLGMRREDKLKPHNPSQMYVMKQDKVSVADYVNKHWFVPDYETERPSGGYLVDDAPINVIVVAMTRGNKGQSYVNPMIDIWSRQRIQPNMFINDPKGELYTAFYATLKLRGYETVVFNLLDPAFTDQFNPLAQIVTYVRKGYKDDPQKHMTALSDTFFPLPEGAEPIWTQGEQMIFEMLAFLLIDFYYEQEQEYLEKNAGVLDEGIIQRNLDIMWQNVTLPNVYRMVTAFSTRKYRELDVRTGEYGEESDVNMLDKLFEVTMDLPMSNIRELFSNPYSNLMSMTDSEKMRSSMYGMALTDMSFFIESPIIALTAASPKQSFDLLNMSFPRRFQFKIHDALTKDQGWIGQAVDFELYKDPEFKERYEGPEYRHSTRIDKLSWTEMRFEAVLENPETYVKIKVRPRGAQDQDMVYGEYYAQFVKGYQKDQTRRNFIKDPVTGNYQIKDGVLYMGGLDENGVFSRDLKPTAVLSNGEEVPVIELTEVAYSEKPFAVFSVTPPSALTYVKIILMIIHLMFNSSVESSYMTKDNGKPLRKTKYMLDEAGNLSYQGTGIDALTTKMSIGLAQGQEFTLILQTLQQITDIYGDKRDRIISSNTGVTVYLLSSDLDMLNEMSERAGKYHRVRYQNKGFSKTEGAILSEVEDTFSYSMAPVEEPLLSVGRLLQMTNGEALVLSTTKRTDNEGSNVRQQPIFNTKDTSLPMSWFLHRHGYMQRKYSMLTVPTANATISQQEMVPPFEALFKRRIQQSIIAPYVLEDYKKQHGLTDMMMAASGDEREARTRELMRRVNKVIEIGEHCEWDTTKMTTFETGDDEALGFLLDTDTVEAMVGETTAKMEEIESTATEDKEVIEAYKKENSKAKKRKQKLLGGGKFSEEDITLPQFKTALTQALEALDSSVVKEPFKLEYKGSGEQLSYDGNVLAYSQKVEETIQEDIKGSDGTTLGRGERRPMAWHVTGPYVEVFKNVKDWRHYLGDPFMNELIKGMEVRKSNEELEHLS